MLSCTTGRMIYGSAIVTIVECNFLLFAMVPTRMYIYSYICVYIKYKYVSV